MFNKLVTVVINGIRNIGKKNYRNLLCIDKTTIISIDNKAKFNVGYKFRTRKNVEINVRDGANLNIGNNVFLNSGCIITAREKIQIGDNTIMGPYVIIYDNDHKITNGEIEHNSYDTAPIIIGKNVWIGAGTIILRGTEIGDNCVIASGTVVKGRIDSRTVLIQKRSSLKKAIRKEREEN